MAPLSIVVFDRYAVDCEITPKLCELVREGTHADILCELARIAGVQPCDISESIQEVCWWVEDRLEDAKCQA